jgi:hypothetical protein
LFNIAFQTKLTYNWNTPIPRWDFAKNVRRPNS